MSLLRDTDTLFVKVARIIGGKMVAEQVKMTAEEVRFLSTPHLLRRFCEEIDRATERLDYAEEFSKTRQ